MATKGKIKIYEDNNYNDFYPLTVSSQVVDLKTNVVNIIKETLSFRKANTSYNLDDKVILNEDFIGTYLICIKQGITAKTDLSYLTDDVEDNEIIIDGTVKWKVHRSAGINSFKTTAFLDSAQNWKTNNPILEKGQIALEEDTGFVKIGDGINTWNFLSYIKDSKLDTKLDKNGTAQKAIKDELNNKIDETYIKKISVDGSTLTFTKGNNISSSITLQNGSYPLATQINDGLMSKEDKIKLDNVNLNSEENQNTFSNISVGATIISADQKTDTLTLKSGQNINLSANNLDDSITIAFTGTVDNANNAIKSKQDYLGQNIHETYIKNIQGNNNKLTIVKGNDVSSIINIDNVPNAIKATQDSDGNAINTTYLKRSGGTMGGALNLANGTLNLAGDDCYFGDQNIAGGFCLKGANGATNLTFIDKDNAAQKASLSYTGGDLISNATIRGNIIGTATNANNLVISGGTPAHIKYGGGDVDENTAISQNKVNLLIGSWHSTGFRDLCSTGNPIRVAINHRNGNIKTTGNVTANGAMYSATPGTSDNSTRVATTAFVQSLINSLKGLINAKNDVYISAGTGSVRNTSFTIPLPSGYSRSQCKYAVFPTSIGLSTNNGYFSLSVDQSTGIVRGSVRSNITGGGYRYSDIGIGYLVVAVK